MAIVVTITADSPTQLAPMWAGLGGHTATVNLDTDHMWIDVDMRQPDEDGAEPFEQVEVEDNVVGSFGDELADLGEEEAEAEAADHDGHTVDVGEVQVAEPEADVVPIDSGSRAKHPAGGTLASKVLTLLQSSPDEEFTPSDVLDSLDADGATYGGISGTIATLVRNGQIQRVGRGKYKAGAAS